MSLNFNPHISVDCVVFGMDSEGLKVLLINRDKKTQKSFNPRKYKLPGDLIIKGEILSRAANRVLREFTGLKNIYLEQFGVFDHPSRLETSDDLIWLENTTGLKINRVITIAYYSLIQLEESKRTSLSVNYNARWFPVKELPEMIFDHKHILFSGLQKLRKGLLTDPLCFELLPEKFTLNQLQYVYENILDINLDNRNFRKKVNRLEYVIPLNEKQTGVSHKPARYYMFDKIKFEALEKEQTGLVI